MLFRCHAVATREVGTGAQHRDDAGVRIDDYTPILEKMGCKAVECEITEKKTYCSCPVKGGFARIGTEERSEVYLISFVPSPKGSH